MNKLDFIDVIQDRMILLTNKIVDDNLTVMEEKYGPYKIVKEEDFIIEENIWTKIELKDSPYCIEIRPQIARILQTDQKDENTGQPIFIVLSSNIMRVKEKHEQSPNNQ